MCVCCNADNLHLGHVRVPCNSCHLLPGPWRAQSHWFWQTFCWPAGRYEPLSLCAQNSSPPGTSFPSTPGASGWQCPLHLQYPCGDKNTDRHKDKRMVKIVFFSLLEMLFFPNPNQGSEDRVVLWTLWPSIDHGDITFLCLLLLLLRLNESYNNNIRQYAMQLTPQWSFNQAAPKIKSTDYGHIAI